MADKIKRVPLNVSVTPDIKKRLEAECESRMIGPVLIVEKALTQYLDGLQADHGGTVVEAAPIKDPDPIKQG